MKARAMVGGLLLGLTLALTSCATMIQGTSQSVGISSNPSSAQVTINGEARGDTPLVIDLRRKDNHVIRIALDGYHPYETTMTRQVSGWVWGNVLFGGLIGLAVDAISGGLYKLTPEQVQAELRQTTATRELEAGTLFIAVVLEPKPEWDRIGSLAPAGRPAD